MNVPCMMPGCGWPGTQLHSHEAPGSDCLLCEGHFKLLFRGAASANDLNLYNKTYNAVLERRKREAAEQAAKGGDQAPPPPSEELFDERGIPLGDPQEETKYSFPPLPGPGGAPDVPQAPDA